MEKKTSCAQCKEVINPANMKVWAVPALVVSEHGCDCPQCKAENNKNTIAMCGVCALCYDKLLSEMIQANEMMKRVDLKDVLKAKEERLAVKYIDPNLN